jgi:TPR repeat protein
MMRGLLAQGVETDRASCEKGDVSACLKLADAYARGQGVTQDLGQATTLYHKVCDQTTRSGCEGLKRILCQSSSTTLSDCPKP